MAKIIPTLARMIANESFPVKRGVWIDVYNKCHNTEIAGTIHTRIFNGNYWYVTEIEDTVECDG